MKSVKVRRNSCRTNEMTEEKEKIYHLGVLAEGEIVRFTVRGNHFKILGKNVTFYKIEKGETRIFAQFFNIIYFIESDEEIIDDSSIKPIILPRDFGKVV